MPADAEHRSDTARDRVPFEELVAGLETDSLDADLAVISVFCLIKSETETGETVWAGRSGGAPMSSEELLGALVGLAESVRQDLAANWEW